MNDMRAMGGGMMMRMHGKEPPHKLSAEERMGRIEERMDMIQMMVEEMMRHERAKELLRE